MEIVNLGGPAFVLFFALGVDTEAHQAAARHAVASGGVCDVRVLQEGLLEGIKLALDGRVADGQNHDLFFLKAQILRLHIDRQAIRPVAISMP